MRIPVGVVGAAMAAAATCAAAASAQNVVVRTTLGTSATVAPGGTLDVPIVVDPSGAAGIASLTLKVAWNPAVLSFVSATSGASGSMSASLGTGELTLVGSSPATQNVVATFATVRFQATAAGASPVSLGVQAAGDAQGQSALARVVAQSLAVCSGTGGGVWGDVNGDGQVDVLDAQQIARYVVGLGVADQARVLRLGDVTNDGQVDILDAQQVARHVVGLAASPRIAQQAPGACAPLAAVGAVRVTQPAAAVAALQTVRLAAAVVDPAGATLVGRAVTWQSSDPTVATVDASGTVRGVTPGVAAITATSEGKSGTAQVTVTPGGPFTLTVRLRSVGAYPVAFVSSTPAGISCVLGAATVATCSGTFAAGTVVRLNASPGYATTLRGWSGDCTPSGADCTVHPATAPVVTATFNGTPVTSKIAYSAPEFDSSVQRFFDRIFVIDPDGGGTVRLPPGPDPEGTACPSWSPDGRRIAYVPYAPDPRSVVVMNADGSGRVEVGPAGAIGLASWYPAGQWLFIEGVPGSNLQTPTIYQYPTSPPQGYDWLTDARRVGVGRSPSVGPDARTIAYETLAGTIALMTTDGAPVRDLGVRGAHPAWSPDGTRLAFTWGSFPDAQIAVLDLTAPPPARPLVLATPGISGSRPRWSPDGTRIAFVGRHVAAGIANVFVIDPDGAGLKQLTRLTSQDVNAAGVSCLSWR